MLQIKDKEMGNCFSDVAAGGTAIGGGGGGGGGGDGGGQNDAVELFLKSRDYHGVYSQIELSLSASRLCDRDMHSKRDPMAVLYMKGRDGKLEELGRTEVVRNSPNPKWINKVSVAYRFELVQTLVFHVYDVHTQLHGVDVKMFELDDQQFLGEAVCALAEVVTKSNRLLTLDLVKHDEVTRTPHPCGKLTVHAEESINSKTTIEIIFRCSELENEDLVSKSDPILMISKISESGTSIPICKTEVISDDFNPTWKPVLLNVQQAGSKDSLLTIECFNLNTNGKHDFIGKVEKSLAIFEKIHSSGIGENLVVPAASGHDYHNKVLKSQLFVEKYSECVQHTFLDYLAGGCELNFMVAVDFTASNGNPRLSDSLHYIDPSGRPNAYQKAIMEVGGVLQLYDSDKRFPAWGFGARPIDGPISHCFNLNGSTTYCEVEGIQGIMTAYIGALFNVSLAGPTLFRQVVNSAASVAGQSLADGRQKYFVLLIITDGVITDLQETKDAIVKAADLPLSILIVGVGGADYKEMEFLNGDKGQRLESTSGQVASRDIVQFVAFRDVHDGETTIAERLLTELPTQFLTYMRNRGIQPNKIL